MGKLDQPALLPLPEAAYNYRRRPSYRLVLAKCACVALVYLSFKAWTPAVSTAFDRPHGGHRHRHGLTTAEREKLFLSVPSAESALAVSREYATHPHLAGSAEDFSDAKVILELFQSEFNISAPSSLPLFSAGTPESRNATLEISSLTGSKEPTAWIDVYYPVLNTPLDRSVEILGQDGETVWTADLVEDGDPLDEEAAKYRDAVPAWHGLSQEGDVTGQLIYANYGTKEDYDELVAAGANLTGKIIITRYGGIFRGLKIKGAQELGAAGVLVYSDPRDDGIVTVANGYSPYPSGPARNPTSVQRGSVQFLSIYPGDPTTPGYPAYENATRTEGENIPKIPSLPISWSNAERLLEEIEGDALTLSGKSSQNAVRLVNHVDTKVTPIWNVMASIPGHITDEVVLVGCHRDAWVMGAADPTSGTVSLHEVIRGFGELLKQGWKPLRTIVFASWDAEEYGLVGSTEWGEDFSEWISSHVVAYLNVDVSVAGSQWNVGGSPSLGHLIKQAALEVPHPTIPGKSLWDAKLDEGPFKNGAGKSDEDVMHAYEVQKQTKTTSLINPLGSGSDFTVFLQRLGIASTDQGFGGTPYDAVYHYHSIYDSQRWQEVYADPGFHRHAAVAKHLGLLALRLADAIVVPLNTTQYALELDQYLDRVEDLIATSSLVSSSSLDFSALRSQIGKLQAASVKLDEEKFEAEKAIKHLLRKHSHSHGSCKPRSRWAKRICDWIKGVFAVPPHQDPVAPSPSGLLGHLTHILEHDDGAKSPTHEFIKAAKRVKVVNKKLASFEQGFISKEGIYEREWYKHLGVAPGKWLGYGATTFPALTEAITIEHNTTLVKLEAARLGSLLHKLSLQITP